MKIADGLHVAIDYRLALETGEEIDRSREGAPLGFVTATGRIIPGLESALYGRKAGESFQVTLEPEDAYGPVDEELFREIPRSRFPEGQEIAPGMTFQSRGPHGGLVVMSVSAADEETVTVDLNHPLAGKRLVFDVTVAEVRAPRPEELAPPSSGCACGPQEQSACGCGPTGQGGGCGSGGSGGGCGCGV